MENGFRGAALFRKPLQGAGSRKRWPLRSPRQDQFRTSPIEASFLSRFGALSPVAFYFDPARAVGARDRCLARRRIQLLARSTNMQVDGYFAKAKLRRDFRRPISRCQCLQNAGLSVRQNWWQTKNCFSWIYIVPAAMRDPIPIVKKI